MLREAALEGARYLIAHLQPTGRYVYEVDMSNGATKGGYSIAGSILTAFVFPRSVAGSRAPAAFTSAGVVWMQDNEP